MGNVWLIARREYVERVRTKGFMLATILIPLLMGALTFGSVYLGSHAKSSAHVAVASSDKAFAEDLKHELESSKDNEMKVDIAEPTTAARGALDAALQDKKSKLAGYLWVTGSANGSETPKFTYKARSAGDIATKGALEGAISSVLMREKLGTKGMSRGEIDAVTQHVTIDTSETGNTAAAFGAAYVLFFLMYMVIMLYGMNVARSIIEEKTSRVFEVLLATIKPEELLAGKILGVGSVGLTQVGIWMIAAAALGSSGLASGLASPGHAIISVSQIAYFIAYFLFGYFLYSSVAAALGAMTNSEQELQQLNMFLVLPLAFCMVMIVSIIRAPDSTLARVVSLIPFCSPLLMNFRLSLTQVPVWEVALSFALMTVTIIAILWVSARIYRVGILMYGKKPNLPEIMRWLKYS